MRKNIRNMFQSQHGMAIVYVIMVVAVVTVVSVTLWQSTQQDVRSVARDQDRSQAYSYAKSGVEIAIGYIIENLNTMENGSSVTYYGKLSQSPFTASIPVNAAGNEDYNIKIEIAANQVSGDTKFLIQSTGYAGIIGEDGSRGSRTSVEALGFEITRKALEDTMKGSIVGAEIPPIIGSDYTANYAVFAKKNISLSSGSPIIKGDVGTNAGPVFLTYSGRIMSLDGTQGTIYLGPGSAIDFSPNRLKDYRAISFQPDLAFPPVPELPAAPEVPVAPVVPNASGIGYSGDLNAGGSVTLSSGSITKYRTVNLGWNDVLIFRLQGDATVIIDQFSSSGEIKIEGDGHLLLVIRNSIDGSRTLINQNGDPEKLTMIVEGSNISLRSGGNGSGVSGTIYAPNANFETAEATNINGDLIIGGDQLLFAGVSHNGTLYAVNSNAEITYIGNRSYVPGTVTSIYSNGTKLSVNPAHLRGTAYLNNSKAQVDLGSSTTFRGNILTQGNKISISGSALLKGHIVAPNPNMEISFTGGSDHEGAVLTGGKTLSFSGGTTALRGLLIAPEADFLLTGGAKITGSITSKTFTADGGSAVTFEKVVYDDLPVVLDPTEVVDREAKSNWRILGVWVKK